MAAILGIHGRSQLPVGPARRSSRDLAAQWTRHLDRALIQPMPPHTMTVAYYSHLLRSPAQGPEDDLDHVTPAEYEAIAAWAHALGIDPAGATQRRLLAPARWIADAAAARFGLDQDLTRAFVGRFFREVVTYLHTPGVRYQVTGLVADSIEETRPRLLLAHSLGSVVAYDRLWTHPELTVDAFITLGSPLALPGVVFDHLRHRPDGGKGMRPPGVRTWINLADPGDLVAIPSRLSRRFNGVHADLTDSIGAFCYHCITGYLGHPATAATVARMITQSSGA
jgi:hypothetical protein